ncbi:hypothetical protein D3C81_1763830 [compost metagenome]
MLHQRAFNIKRPYPIAGSSDHVIITAYEANAAIVVEFCCIAAQVVTPHEGLGWHAEVTTEPILRRALAIDCQRTRLAGR